MLAHLLPSGNNSTLHLQVMLTSLQKGHASQFSRPPDVADIRLSVFAQYFFSLLLHRLVGRLIWAINFQTVDLSRPLSDCHKICTHVWCGFKPESLPAIFLPHPKNLAKKNFRFRRQLEARNFEMAQNVDKQKLYLSSTINALKRCQTWGVTPQSFDVTQGEN